MRSPRRAPCENGLEGSTETTPAVLPAPADVGEQRPDQARLADPRRAGDTDGVGVAGLRIEVTNDLGGKRVGALDERDRARERTSIAGADTCDQRLASPGPCAHGVHPTAETASASASSWLDSAGIPRASE